MRRRKRRAGSGTRSPRGAVYARVPALEENVVFTLVPGGRIRLRAVWLAPHGFVERSVQRLEVLEDVKDLNGHVLPRGSRGTVTTIVVDQLTNPAGRPPEGSRCRTVP